MWRKCVACLRFERICKKVLHHCCFVSLAPVFLCLVLSKLNGYTITCPCQGGSMQKRYVERATHQIPRPTIIEDGNSISFAMEIIGQVSKQHWAHLGFAFLAWKQTFLPSDRFQVFESLKEILHTLIPFGRYDWSFICRYVV